MRLQYLVLQFDPGTLGGSVDSMIRVFADILKEPGTIDVFKSHFTQMEAIAFTISERTSSERLQLNDLDP